MLQRQEVQCILRNSGAGWHIIQDAFHQPIGVKNVTQYADHIRLHFSFTAKHGHSFHITADEAYAVMDQYRAGASVGPDVAIIYFGKPGVNAKVNPALIKNPSGNFWVSGFFSVELPDPT